MITQICIASAIGFAVVAVVAGGYYLLHKKLAYSADCILSRRPNTRAFRLTDLRNHIAHYTRLHPDGDIFLDFYPRTNYCFYSSNTSHEIAYATRTFADSGYRISDHLKASGPAKYDHGHYTTLDMCFVELTEEQERYLQIHQPSPKIARQSHQQSEELQYHDNMDVTKSVPPEVP
jgi:hypothetical protein